MRAVFTTSRFKKDFRLAIRRGKNIDKFQAVIDLLVMDAELPDRCRPHKLSGQYEDQWECHIESDWLLIYNFREGQLWLNRIGTHSDLFD